MVLKEISQKLLDIKFQICSSIIIILAVTYSCKIVEYNNDEDVSEFIFSDSIKVYSGNMIESTTFDDIIKHNKKILVLFYDDDCSSCTYKRIYLWNKNRFKFEDLGGGIYFVFIGEYEHFTKVVYQESNISDLIILDKDGDILRTNNIAKHQEDKKVILLDSNNRVLEFGSPIFDSDVETKYINKLMN